MFGHRFFGAHHFGPRYFGDGGSGAPPEPPVVVAERYAGGWEPHYKRKTRQERYEERVRMGILPKKIVEAAKKVVDKAVEPVAEKVNKVYHRPDEAELVAKLMVELRVTREIPDYSKAIHLALLAKKRQEEDDDDEVILLLMH